MKPRRLLAALMTLFMALSIVGCHGKKTSTGFVLPDGFDTSKQFEISFWAKNDTNKNQTAIYKKAVEDFEKLYPNIKVNLKLYTDYGKIYSDIITNISTGTTPNVAITYPDHIASYLEGDNTVVPLDDLMNDEQYGLGGSELRFTGPTREEIVPEFLEEGVIGSSQYALPFMRSTEALYINKDYVEKLGHTVPDIPTWEWVWEVSQAAAKKNPDGNYALNNKKVMIPFIYKSTDNMMIQMLKQLNAGYSTDQGEIDLFNDTTTDLLEQIADYTKSGAFSTFKVSGYPANFLNAGQTVFAVDSTAGSTWMGAHAPLSDISPDAFVEFETVVRPVPQMDPENPQMISQGPSIAIFNKKDPQEVMASWLFAQYLLSNEVQLGYSKTEGYLPVTTTALQSAEYQDYLAKGGSDDNDHYNVKIDAVKMLMDHTADTFTTPVFNGSASLRNAAGELIESTVKSVRRNQPVNDETIAELYTKVNGLYHLDQSGFAVSGKDLGPLPASSIALLATLAVVWIGILVYVLNERRKKSS